MSKVQRAQLSYIIQMLSIIDAKTPIQQNILVEIIQQLKEIIE